jgi:hypothetical protein
MNSTFVVPRNAAVPTGKFCKLTPATVDFLMQLLKSIKLAANGILLHVYMHIPPNRSFISYAEFHKLEY